MGLFFAPAALSAIKRNRTEDDYYREFDIAPRYLRRFASIAVACIGVFIAFGLAR